MKVPFSKYLNIESGMSPAYILIIIILTILAVFLFYSIFNDYVTTVFPQMVVDNGGDFEYATFSVVAWQTYFVVAFVISMIIFVLVNAQRRED